MPTVTIPASAQAHLDIVEKDGDKYEPWQSFLELHAATEEILRANQSEGHLVHMPVGSDCVGIIVDDEYFIAPLLDGDVAPGQLPIETAGSWSEMQDIEAEIWAYEEAGECNQIMINAIRNQLVSFTPLDADILAELTLDGDAPSP